jgi:hypothetical protein
MLGSTLGGAVAVSMDDMSGTFGVANTAYVVGSDAGNNDDSARDVLANYFGGFVDTESGAVVASSDVERLYFGENLTQEFSAILDDGDFTLDDGDVDSLWDDGVDFRGSNYETHEQIMVSSDSVAWITTSGLTAEEELGSNPALYTNGGNTSWGYRYVFDETMTSNISTDHEFKLDFLGKELRISDVAVTGNHVTFTTGTQASVGQSESLSVDEHTINIGTIFSTKVEVSVDGESPKFLDEGDEETFNIGSDQVEIKIDDIGYAEDVESRTVLITYGEDISTTVGTGDAVQTELGMPDVDDKSGDAVWNWDIDVTTNDIFTNTDYIGIEWNQKVNKHNDDPLPLGAGENFATPYGYATLDFDVVDQDYVEYTFEFESTKTINSSIDEDVLIITAVGRSGENDGLDIAGTDTDQVLVNASGYVYYYDGDGDWQGGGWANTTTVGTGLSFEPSTDTTKYITFYGVSGAILNGSSAVAYMDVEDVESGDENSYTGSYFRSNMTIGSEKLGATQGTAEAGDLYYYRFVNPELAAATLTEVQSWDEGALLSAYGIKVTGSDGSDDIKDAIESDELFFWLPEDEVYAELSFNVRSTATEYEPILVADASAASYDNLILVGGPCVNTLTADYLGLPVNSCEADSGIALDKAIIQLVEKEGKTALIVAGYEQVDTLRAANAVAAGGLTGETPLIV